MCQEEMFHGGVSEEDLVKERVDENGNVWRKVYFGGGSHFNNWLDQVIELRGEDNVEVEETNPSGFKCYEESGEKVYRIWVKEPDLSARSTLENK